MWRAFFCAVGVTLLILGAECLVLEKAVLAGAGQETPPMSPFDHQYQPQATGNREFVPPEWAPWSLLSAGAVIMLYTFTLSRDGK